MAEGCFYFLFISVFGVLETETSSSNEAILVMILSLIYNGTMNQILNPTLKHRNSMHSFWLVEKKMRITERN